MMDGDKDGGTTQRRLLCVWLPHWPITRLRQPPLPGKPLVTVNSEHGQRRVVAVEPGVDGLLPGQTLAEARALYPGLIPLEADPAGDLAALQGLAAWAERYTPLAAPDVLMDRGPNLDHGLWLDITGCAHLLGGEAALLADLSARLARQDILARLALAGTAGAAWALARMPGGNERIVVPPGGEEAALVLLPIAALRLAVREVAALRQVGVRTIGNLLRLPRADVTARFGAMAVLRLDQALGRAEEAIAWPRPAVPFHEVLAFAEPIGTAEDLSHALALLAERVCARLDAAGQGGLRFVARFFRVDNSVREIALALARPGRDAAYLAKLLGMKLETVDPGFGVEAVSLAAEESAVLSAVQAEAFRIADDLDGLDAVVDRLANDLGPERVWRVAPFPSHVPERAVARVPVLQCAPGWESDPSCPRPIRLLRRPEPIEVTAPVPDDPPILFRWRRRVHRVRAATGPERIAAEWWKNKKQDLTVRLESDLIRDYYQVEDADGAKFWVFRAGLHGGERQRSASDQALSAPRWFLHGLFA